jgi:hypothetical protein
MKRTETFMANPPWRGVFDSGESCFFYTGAPRGTDTFTQWRGECGKPLAPGPARVKQCAAGLGRA